MASIPLGDKLKTASSENITWQELWLMWIKTIASWFYWSELDWRDCEVMSTTKLMKSVLVTDSNISCIWLMCHVSTFYLFYKWWTFCGVCGCLWLSFGISNQTLNVFDEQYIPYCSPIPNLEIVALFISIYFLLYFKNSTKSNNYNNEITHEQNN